MSMHSGNMDSKKKKGVIVLGITGGIGSGKSTAAEIIRKKGHTIISSDERARRIMADDPKIRKKLKAAFGDNTFDEQGRLNSQFLASLVFGDTPEHDQNLSTLNAIVHPAVIDDMIEQVERLERTSGGPLFVESALIYEAGLQDGFDYVVVVHAEEEKCIQRAAKRGIDPVNAQMRMIKQLPPERKKGLADFVIENNGTIEELEKAVNLVLNIITHLPPRRPGDDEQ